MFELYVVNRSLKILLIIISCYKINNNNNSGVLCNMRASCYPRMPKNEVIGL